MGLCRKGITAVDRTAKNKTCVHVSRAFTVLMGRKEEQLDRVSNVFVYDCEWLTTVDRVISKIPNICPNSALTAGCLLSNSTRGRAIITSFSDNVVLRVVRCCR